MKRNKNLVKLSHDHYHGLMLANLIKKGAPVQKRLPNDMPGKIKYTVNMFKTDISRHFEDEEKILFPTIRGKSAKIDSVIDEILAEHKKMLHIVASIPSADDAASELHLLGNTLEKHIRKEERILFPEAEKILTDDELALLGRKLNDSGKS